MAASTTPATSSSSASPTVPLELAHIINDIATGREASLIHSQPPATGFSFDPQTPHGVHHPLTQLTGTLTASPTVTSTFTTTRPPPTLQTEAHPTSSGPWNQQSWVGVITWLLLIYNFLSLFLLVILWIVGVLDWRLRLNLDVIRTRRYGWDLDRENEQARRLSSNARRLSRRQRDSIETELGDPEEEEQLELMRRQWADRGMHFTDDELRAQQQAYEAHAARVADIERRDAIVIANLRAHGILL